MKHSLVRQKIVETASGLFYKNGYNLTGINEIISEAGIAKATLYNHFKSKEEICLAYLQYRNTTFLNDIKSFALAPPKGKKQLLALFVFLQKFFKEPHFNGCWCIKTVAEIPMDNEIIRKEIQVEKNQFLQLIQQLMTTNFPDNSEKENTVLAKQIYVLYEGAVAESHLHRDAWPITAAKDICNKILV